MSKTLIPENILQNSLSKPIFNLNSSNPVTIYIRSDGNDINSGIEDTPEGALATPSAAISKIFSSNCIASDIVLNLGVGNYDGNLFALPKISSKQCTLQGSGDETIINVSSANFTNRPNSWWSIKNLKFSLSNTTRVQNIAGYMDFQNVSFVGTTTQPMLFFGNKSGGNISNVIFNGNAATCLNTNSGGQVVMSGNITVNGTYDNIINILNGGFAVSVGSGAKFLGSPTGRRFNVSHNGILDTGGSGPNFIVGTIAGNVNTTTGGVYL